MAFARNQKPSYGKPRAPKPVESSTAAVKRYLGWLLARREYATSELTAKALGKGYASEHVQEALAFLREHGLQDDERYAGMKARQSAARRGDRLIAQTLRSKKLPETVIQAQLDELPAEVERAYKLLDRYEGQEWSMELKQQAWKRLATRGFGSDAIKAALRQLEETLRSAGDS